MFVTEIQNAEEILGFASGFILIENLLKYTYTFLQMTHHITAAYLPPYERYRGALKGISNIHPLFKFANT